MKPSRKLMVHLRNYFTYGLLVLAPTAVTVWILIHVFRLFDGILGRWYTRLFDYLNALNITSIDNTHIPGLGAITLAVLVTLIGFIARQYVGKKTIFYWEKLVTRVPLFNRIYLAVRQLSDTLASDSAVFFKRPVMLQYPRLGIWSIGFVTRDCGPAFCRVCGEDVSTVFIPTTPNPTSGVILFVPCRDLKTLNMTVEDAMKLIISAGVVTPDIKLPES